MAPNHTPLLQLALFGDVALYCECCGQTSANEYVHRLNHSKYQDGRCVTETMKARHK